MCATTSSSATFASGGRSAASSSTTPAPNETWRQSGTGAPRRASDCERFAYAAAATISSSGAPASITASTRQTLDERRATARRFA